MNETCPICLEPLTEHDNVLCMPVCMHKIHTMCELKAAQYDARCPVCRTKDPRLTTRTEDDVAVYNNLERLATEYDSTVRRYKRKRARVINQHSKLGRLRERLKKERKDFVSVERELERHWMKLQRESWNNNPEIVRLKNERRRYQRRSNTICKKLENELEERLGPRPDDVMFQFANS